MATSAVQLNSELVPAELCHRAELCHKNVQELTDLIIHHSPRFRRIAQAHLGNVADAEDALQDAVLSALTHMDQYRGQAKLSTWLTTIVVNSARMKLRRRSVQLQIVCADTDQEQSLSLEEIVSDTRPSPEEICRKREIAAILADAISRLSPTLLRAFQLRDVDGLSIRETAHLLGVPSGTVKARTARARKKLKQFMRGVLKPVSAHQSNSSLRHLS